MKKAIYNTISMQFCDHEKVQGATKRGTTGSSKVPRLQQITAACFYFGAVYA